MALGAGAVDVHAVTEELSAALFGWPMRTFEAAVPQGKLGMGWAMFAYRTWQWLSWVDTTLLARVIPREVFYNVLVTSPGSGRRAWRRPPPGAKPGGPQPQVGGHR
jgi:hypothetical protein